MELLVYSEGERGALDTNSFLKFQEMSQLYIYLSLAKAYSVDPLPRKYGVISRKRQDLVCIIQYMC